MNETLTMEGQAQEPAGQTPSAPPVRHEPAALAPPAPARGSWSDTERQAFDPRRKSPRFAALLSVVPGVGQVYVGYYVRGFVLAATFLGALMIAINAPSSLEPVPGFAVFFVWLFNVIDAGRMAALYNYALAGSDRIQLPEDFQVPAMGGSIVGGAVLVLFGVIALSNTLFGMSLEWIESWWPVFPIALGAYLVARGVLDRAAE